MLRLLPALLATHGFAAAAGAASIGLDTLDPSYAQESGGLLFSNFVFDLDGGDASLFMLSIEGTRVTLEGPMEVMGNGAQADFAMSFDVAVVGTEVEAGIGEARLLTPTEILDNGFPTYMLGESLSAAFASASLATSVFNGTDMQQASVSFEPMAALSVRTGASLRSSGPGDYVRLGSLSNEFTLVPEPSTAASLALGLLGLATAGRRR